MSYDSYRSWLSHQKVERLDEEIVKLRKRVQDCEVDTQAYKAWKRMLEMAEQVVKTKNNAL